MSMAMVDQILAETNKIVAVKDHIGCKLGEDEVILNLMSGIYYGLNNVGSSIWELVQKPIAVEEIVDALFIEYEIDRSLCEEAVRHFLTELSEHGLVEVSS